MSAEPPPADSNGGYNPDDWTNANDPIDNQYLAQNYLQFPNAQGAETLGEATISGTLTASDATFGDLVTFNNGIDIATTAGIKFSDDSVQTVAFIEADYAQLSTDNVFLAPNQNTFAGNASTNNANAPIKLTNGVAGEYATLYLNPSSGEDITLYTNQNPLGGLTIRGANGASFTMNPASVQDGLGCQFMNPVSMNGSTLSGLINVYGNAGGTIAFQNVANFNAGATLTGTPTALQTTNVANVAYVNNSISTALVPYSTTTQMNSAISSALTPYAPINSPTFTGLPLLTTTPTAGVSNAQAIANLQYITNQGYATTTYVNNALAPYATTTYVNNALAPYAPLASPALTGTPTAPTQPANSTGGAIANVDYVATAISNISPTALPFFYAAVGTITWNQVTTGYFNGNYYSPQSGISNGAYDQVQAGVATISFTVPKNPVNYPVFATATMQGNIQFPTGGTNLNSNTGPYQPFSGGSTPYSWNGTQYIWGYGCTVQPPSISGTYTITITAQTFFSVHLNTSSNIGADANPFSQVSFICYQS